MTRRDHEYGASYEQLTPEERQFFGNEQWSPAEIAELRTRNAKPVIVNLLPTYICDDDPN